MKNRKKEVLNLIKDAEILLPGTPAPDGEIDPRWQAINAISNYIEEEPEEVWQFICKWGRLKDKDLQGALATCLLEHLLEDHFNEYFPRVKEMCKQNKEFAEMFLICSKFGQSELPDNSLAIDDLEQEIINSR